MSESDWISEIRRRDPRYARGAYEFVQDALRLAHLRAGREGHVSGRELLEAFRALAREQFGPLAASVLAEWNVRTTEDVGNIVFLCVQAGEMGKTEDDTLDDFRGVYDFEEAFPSGIDSVQVVRPTPEEEEDEEEDE